MSDSKNSGVNSSFVGLIPLLIVLMVVSAICFIAISEDNAKLEKARENRVDTSNFRDIEGIDRFVSSLNDRQIRQVFAAMNHANIALNNMVSRPGSEINPGEPLLDQVHLMYMGDYFLLFTSMHHLSETDLYPYIMAFYNSETATIKDYKTFVKAVMTAVMED